MSGRRLQHVFTITIFCLSRRLENVLQIRLEDVLKASRKTSWRRLGRRKIVLLNTCSRRLDDVLKTSSRQTKCLLAISASNHGLLTNINHYLTNLYLTSLYFTNLRRIQNSLIRKKDPRRKIDSNFAYEVLVRRNQMYNIYIFTPQEAEIGR